MKGEVAQGKRVILLVNLGTPREPTPQAVREFLSEFLSDPLVVDYPRGLWRPILDGIILRSRPPKVAEMYRSIWTEEGSPLAAGSERMATQLQEILGAGAEVRVVYRYGRSSLAGELAALATEEVAEVVTVALFPQRTESSLGTIISRFREAAPPELAPRIKVARIAPDDPGYIEACAARFRDSVAAWGCDPEHLVISFHGIPTRYDRREGGLYRADCQATADALMEACGWSRKQTTLSYQSRFGPEPWLRPNTASVLSRLPQRGISRVAIIAPGFLTDGIETLEEMGVRGRATFLEAGGKDMLLVPAVADHPAMIGALAEAVDAKRVRPMVRENV